MNTTFRNSANCERAKRCDKIKFKRRCDMSVEPFGSLYYVGVTKVLDLHLSKRLDSSHLHQHR